MHRARRLLAIFFAFFAACIAGSATMSLLLIAFAKAEPHALSELPQVFLGILLSMFVFSLLPALLAIVIGEIGRFTSLYFYLLSGAVIGAIVDLSIKAYILRPDILWLYWRYMPGSMLPMAAVFAVSGAAAGTAYWFIAGRYAGGWRPAQLPALQTKC
jgi:hypothetical protein